MVTTDELIDAQKHHRGEIKNRKRKMIKEISYYYGMKIENCAFCNIFVNGHFAANVSFIVSNCEYCDIDITDFYGNSTLIIQNCNNCFIKFHGNGKILNFDAMRNHYTKIVISNIIVAIDNLQESTYTNIITTGDALVGTTTPKSFLKNEMCSIKHHGAHKFAQLYVEDPAEIYMMLDNVLL